MPDGWSWARVESVCAVGTGATPPKTNKAHYDNGTIPWVTSGSASLGIVDKPDGYISELAPAETNCTISTASKLDALDLDVCSNLRRKIAISLPGSDFRSDGRRR